MVEQVHGETEDFDHRNSGRADSGYCDHRIDVDQTAVCAASGM